MSLSATDSEDERPGDLFYIKSIYDKLKIFNSEEESEDLDLRQDTLSVKSDATLVLPKTSYSFFKDLKRDLSSAKVYEMKLRKWVLYLRNDFRNKGLMFLKDLQDTAQRSYSFLIEDPEIKFVNDYITSMKDIEAYLKASVLSSNPIKLFMAVIPSLNANTIYINLKNLITSCPMSSQIIHEPTLSKKFSLPSIVDSIKVKCGVDFYTNPRNLLGDGRVANLESKIFRGTVLIPHEARYFSDQGTRCNKGKITIEEDGVEHVLEYERSSLVNWPTFYPDDVVEFRVKFNDNFTHLALCDLMLKPKESFEKSKETRVTGRLYDYKPASHSGIMLCDDGRQATFRRDEILLDSNYDLSTERDRGYEFTMLTTELEYLRAIRILVI